MTRSIYTQPAFWQATAERAVSTVAQTGVATIGVDAIASGGVLAVDWIMVGSITALAGILSVLKSVAVGAGGNGPGIGDAETLNEG